MQTRRSVLTGLLGTIALSGCIFGDEWESGDLVVRNRHTGSTQVDLTLEKHYETPRDDIPTSGPPPEDDPIWDRSESFDLQAEGTVHEPGYVEEVGTYYVTATVQGGGNDTMWLVFAQAGDGIGGPAILITVSAPDTITIDPWFED